MTHLVFEKSTKIGMLSMNLAQSQINSIRTHKYDGGLFYPESCELDEEGIRQVFRVSRQDLGIEMMVLGV